jgi:hypothetical protein
MRVPPGAQVDNSLVADDADLVAFGITKPKQFKRLLETAMTKVAREDYE